MLVLLFATALRGKVGDLNGVFLEDQCGHIFDGKAANSRVPERGCNSLAPVAGSE
jgi:hypothetical protein